MPKLNPNRTPMRRLEPATRVRSFDEVDLGYSEEEALAEAARCLFCPRPGCVEGCPARNDVPGFIRAMTNGDYAGAAAILAETTTLPGICSRVCDHAKQCEGGCNIGKRGDPVSVGALERFVADWARTNGVPNPPANARPRTGKAVAIVGAGPAGIAAAGQLVRQGHDVEVFDRLPTAGGVLAAGIPLFRLSKDVLDWPIQNLKNLGVRFYSQTSLGRDLSIDFLLGAGYDAVFLGIGASAPTWPKVPGERLPGVWQARSFLAQTKLAQLGAGPDGSVPRIGRRVAVIGAGNTAMDVAQTARRLGADQVTVVYRRSAAEVPARQEEVESAKEEGVQFHFLTAPVGFVEGSDGRVKEIECIQMALGEPGADGRRRPVAQPGTEFRLAVDTVVLALGWETDPAVVPFLEEIGLDKYNQVLADPTTGRTTRPGVWAGGDLVTGAATVVHAMAAGRRAAADIDAWLAGEDAAAAQPVLAAARG